MEQLKINDDQFVSVDEQSIEKIENAELFAPVSDVDSAKTNLQTEVSQTEVSDSTSKSMKSSVDKKTGVFAEQATSACSNYFFLLIGKIPMIWALFFVANDRDKFDQEKFVANDNAKIPNFDLEKLKKFRDLFVRECQNRGMTLTNPAICDFCHRDDILDQISKAAESKFEYILIVTDERIKDLHDQYKLKGKQNEIIVQNCKSNTAELIISGRKHFPLRSIVGKFNLYFGGLNFDAPTPVILENQLVVGIGLSRTEINMNTLPSSKILNPFSIGYSSNAKNDDLFAGGFVLAQDESNIPDCIKKIMGKILEKYQNSRKSNPETIVIYRAGVADGNYPSVLEIEIPLIRNAMKELNIEAKLTYVVTNKDTARRFPKNDGKSTSSESGSVRGRDQESCYEYETGQNIQSEHVINPETDEIVRKIFYLKSISNQPIHSDEEKVRAYTVLSDDEKNDVYKLKSMTLNFRGFLQKSEVMTSIPLMLFFAIENARKGKELLVAMKTADFIGTYEEKMTQFNQELSNSSNDE